MFTLRTHSAATRGREGRMHRSDSMVSIPSPAAITSSATRSGRHGPEGARARVAAWRRALSSRGSGQARCAVILSFRHPGRRRRSSAGQASGVPAG